jgi:RNA polymerase sigma-70 factor (ECF subfamily)
MDSSVDEALVQGLAEGREEAFAALYDHFAPVLFRVAVVLLGSRPDAEDAVQEVLVGLVRARGMLGQVSNLRAYLFACLRSAAGRIAARRKHRPEAIGDAADIVAPQASGPNLEQSVRLERALRDLPPQQRELVALKVDGGLTFAEIASCLGISANTAASRYRYALEKLRAALEENSHEHTRSPC